MSNASLAIALYLQTITATLDLGKENPAKAGEPSREGKEAYMQQTAGGVTTMAGKETLSAVATMGLERPSVNQVR